MKWSASASSSAAARAWRRVSPRASRVLASSSRRSRPACTRADSSSCAARVSAMRASSSWSGRWLRARVRLGQARHVGAETLEQLAPVGGAGAEGVQALVVPAQQRRAGRCRGRRRRAGRCRASGRCGRGGRCAVNGSGSSGGSHRGGAQTGNCDPPSRSRNRSAGGRPRAGRSRRRCGRAAGDEPSWKRASGRPLRVRTASQRPAPGLAAADEQEFLVRVVIEQASSQERARVPRRGRVRSGWVAAAGQVELRQQRPGAGPRSAPRRRREVRSG